MKNLNSNNMDTIEQNIIYLYLFFLVIIFFIYGLTLSEIIDYIFPDHNENIHDYRTGIEIIGEIGIAYIIYFSLKHYLEGLISGLFNKISKKPPFYLDQLLLIAFSIGIFKHLQKSTNKVTYFKKKFINMDKIRKKLFFWRNGSD